LLLQDRKLPQLNFVFLPEGEGFCLLHLFFCNNRERSFRQFLCFSVRISSFRTESRDPNFERTSLNYDNQIREVVNHRSRTMKFGLGIPNHGESANAGEQVKAARIAEESGYDSVWTDDHIIVPMRFEKEYGFMNEALMTLSYIAARTEKVKLGTSVIVLPQRNPVLLAKQVATLDTLSNGRAILGVGGGWMEDEFKMLGAGDNFRYRGVLLDESIELMRELWTKNPVNIKGRFFDINEGVFLPKPQKAIPIWIGGMSDAAIERAAKLGDVYHPLWTTPEGLGGRVKKLRELGSNIPVSLRMPIDMHRNRSIVVRTSGTRMHQIAGSIEKITREIEEYSKAGMQHLLVEFEVENPEMLFGDIKSFATEVIKSFDS